MADTKTILSEVCALIEIGLINDRGYGLNPSEYESNIISKFAIKYISNISSDFSILLSHESFSPSHISAIKNSSKLGNHINKVLNVQKSDILKWVGNDTQKEIPYDIIVGENFISLKEESFILENMGLYSYLNIMTNKTFKRGLHIFKNFSNKEYNDWFLWTWDYLKSNVIVWEINEKGIDSSIRVDKEFIILKYGNESSIIPSTLNGIEDFEEYTNSITREKVFAKWINYNLKNNITYQSIKKICSSTAGQNLVDFIYKHFNDENITRLLQIYELEYYYGKSTSNETTLYRIPSKANYKNEICIEDISWSVPDSQLNIFTVIKNLKTGKSLRLRNELRFSHGQFNGTPEAKMYYDLGSNLEVIYSEVIDK